MKIHVYHCPDAPAAHAYLARTLVEAGFLPVLFKGRTAEEARERAQATWDAEAAKLDKTGRRPMERAGQADPVEVKHTPADDSLCRMALEPVDDLADLLG